MVLASMRIGAVALGFAATPALAQSAELAGTLGYVSEWEVTAKVTPHDSAGHREFAGPLTVRHIGLCAPGRPVEMAGEIRYRVTGWLNRRMDATLVIDGTECGFEGKLAEAYEGVLTCPQWRGVPLTLSLKAAH
jgi:hypothetical protein